MTSLPPEVEYPMEPLNEVYLLAKFDVSSFSMTGDIQIFKLVILLTLSTSRVIVILLSFSYFGQVKIDPTHSFFTKHGQVTVTAKRNASRIRLTKNLRTTHRILPKSFSLIQSAVIKNWVTQLLNSLQRFNLLFISVTRFSNWWDKTKYV